jgi:ABC-type multidrug transport system ATPase subunit
MELAAAPLALFLDERTSGLDATAAMDVCNLLRDIAQETGITVAMVIHQPRVEIWNHLDDILLLGPGGKTVYLGQFV